MDYYQEEVEGFIDANGDANLGFWEVETPSVIPPSAPLPLPLDRAAYPLKHFIAVGSLLRTLRKRCQQMQLRLSTSFSLRRITIH